MRNRQTIPLVNAFHSPVAIEWDAPKFARERWAPDVRAAATDERTVNMYDEIGDRGDGRGVTVAMVRAALRRMGPGDVTVNLNSPGGDFFAGLAIYNLLREHDGKVSTNILGVAASAASLIAMASDELKIAKAGFLMIHNSWGVVIGNRHELTATANMLGQFDDAMAGVYADRSGIAKTIIAEYMDANGAAGTFFSGESAVDLGLADALLPSDAVTTDEQKPATVAATEKSVLAALQGLRSILKT